MNFFRASFPRMRRFHQILIQSRRYGSFILGRPIDRIDGKLLDLAIGTETGPEPIVKKSSCYFPFVTIRLRHFCDLLFTLDRIAPGWAGHSTLIDWGAGKGRCLVLAARHGVSGLCAIERDQVLAVRCRENLLATGKVIGCRWSVFNGEAAEYRDFANANILYAYNPCTGLPFERTIERVSESLSRVDGTFLFCYTNPVQNRMLEANGHFAYLEVVRSHGFLTAIYRFQR